MLGTVKEAWENDVFTQSLSSFGSFCEMLGMSRLPDFFSAHNFHRVQDWSAQPLDGEGQAMQASILDRSQVMLSTLGDHYRTLTRNSTSHSA
jgi:exportin-5